MDKTTKSQCINDNKTNNRNKNNNKYNNNIIIINHTEPGVRLSDADADNILRAYMNNVAPTMSGAVAGEIEEALSRGLTIDDVIECINRTGFAPRPSPAYLRAVLRNFDASGKKENEVKKAWWQRNPALNYDQREYHDEDFDGSLFMAEVEKMQHEK